MDSNFNINFYTHVTDYCIFLIIFIFSVNLVDGLYLLTFKMIMRCMRQYQ